MVLGAKFHERGKGCGDFDDGRGIEPDIAVVLPISDSSVERFDQQTLAVEIETSKRQLVEIISFAGRHPLEGFVSVGDFLCVNRLVQQEQQIRG